METGYTIVVGNQDLLSVLCGANDENLRIIEDYLGVPVITKGNELTVASSNADICRKFQDIVDTVMSTQLYADSSPEMISTLIAGLNDKTAPAMADSFIQIPHGLKRIYPRTVRQAEYIRLVQEYEIVFCLGPAGTGKTFLAVAEALKMVLSRQMRKIVLTRPVVEAGESLGFLPGNLEQKIDPYLRPLYDAIESLVPPDIIHKMEESGMIEIAPLAYMRGRSIDNAIIILDEAQNTTENQMKMFLTRLGNDPSQIDLPKHTISGLSDAVAILHDIQEIAVLRFEKKDVIRNHLVKKIVQAYEQNAH